MFTFKKLALVGVAGLAAFALSCSDDNGDETEPVGAITGLAATSDATGTKITGGTITANGDGVIINVALKANDVAIPVGSITPPIPTGLGTDAVSLAGTTINGICGLLSATGSTEVKLTVTATISAGEESASTISDEVSVTIACAATDVQLRKGSIILSTADSSFADIDANPYKRYKDAGVTATTADLIDLIAKYNSATKGAIYAPGDDNAPAKAKFASATNAKDVRFYPLPDAAEAVINGLTTKSQATTWTASPEFTAATATGVKQVPVTTKAFLVLTSAGSYAAVVVTANTDASITLSITSL